MRGTFTPDADTFDAFRAVWGGAERRVSLSRHNSAMRLGRDDQVFFRERSRYRAPGVSRSLARARSFAPLLGLDLAAITAHGPPIISVVGSKGKGTAAVFAAALLEAAGLRVGLLTSPGLRSNRERIRVGGCAVSAAEFAVIAARLAAALDAAPEPADGYLSPTGLFTLSAVRHFIERDCDAMVLEAGMGGMSDEISLFDPAVVAVSPIFAEHLGILGDSVEGIAANKLGVVRPTTQAVVAVAQADDSVEAVITAVSGGRRVTPGAADAAHVAEVATGLVATNAALGMRAGFELLKATGRQPPLPMALDATLRSVRLPARLSVHRHGDTLIGLDSAINSTGAAATRQWFETVVGVPDAAVVCIPDDKDRTGVLQALDGLNVVPVRLEAEHLHFEEQAAAPPFDSVDLALGERVLCIGTVSFVGEVLDVLDEPTDRVFDSTSVTPGAVHA